MSGTSQVTYTVPFGARSKSRNQNAAAATKASAEAIPRIARLLALAIRIDRLVREQAVPDYAAVARLGRVSRARMTQIMRLCNLAPDIQEQILFLRRRRGIGERNLRPIVQLVGWEEQRRLFRDLVRSSAD